MGIRLISPLVSMVTVTCCLLHGTASSSSPSPSPNRTVVNLAVLLPYDPSWLFSRQRVEPAVELAIEAVERRGLLAGGSGGGGSGSSSALDQSREQKYQKIAPNIDWLIAGPVLSGMAQMSDIHALSVKEWLDLVEMIDLKNEMERDANKDAEREAKRK